MQSFASVLPLPTRLCLRIIYAIPCYQNFIRFYAKQYFIVRRYHTLFTHSSVHGTFELLPLFGYYEHSCPSSCVNANFSIFLCIYLPYSTYVLRNCQTVFQRGSTNLHSRQKSIRIPICLHQCQYLLLPILSGIVILVGGKWYFLIVLTSISLRTNYG